VEEDIPPNWEEILPNFSKTTLEQRPTTGTITPLIFLKPAETGCMVEEEIPPQMEDYCKNSVDVKDEDPKINWDDFCKEDDTHRKTYIKEHAHTMIQGIKFCSKIKVLIIASKQACA
jgi:hypothetical protein